MKQKTLRLFMRCLLGISLTPIYGQTTPPAQDPSQNAVRTWTTVEGRLFQASFVSCDGVQVVLRLPNGQTPSVPIQRFSVADQAFIRNASGLGAPVVQRAGDPKVPDPRTAVLLPIEKRVWPQKVEPDNLAIEVKLVSEASGTQQYVYHSQNFEFIAQDKLAGTVMKELARTFEATKSLVEALPWGIQPTPPADLGYYRAKLYVDRKSYVAEGGPPESGGVYFRKDRMFRVPFQSLGLELRGKTWFKDENFNNRTIVHEVTHQMMHDFLNFLPIWITEGTADYTGMIPLHTGRFTTASHERGIKEYIRLMQTQSLSFSDLVSPAEMLRMTHDDWHKRSDKGGRDQTRLYYSACMMVYFFCHLDGDGKGTAFLQYFDKIRGARDEWRVFFKTPGVTQHPDGSYTYSQSVPLPKQPASEETGIGYLNILLNGRDNAQLNKAFIDGFKKIGVSAATAARPSL